MSVIKNPCKIYIGNIPRDADEGQIEKMFYDVGSFLSLEFKGDFAFVEYGTTESSEEAIRYVKRSHQPPTKKTNKKNKNKNNFNLEKITSIFRSIF